MNLLLKIKTERIKMLMKLALALQEVVEIQDSKIKVMQERIDYLEKLLPF